MLKTQCLTVPLQVVNLFAFNFLLGVGSVSHTTVNALERIKSDPSTQLMSWNESSSAFLKEQARINPPVASFNSLVPNDLEVGAALCGSRSVWLSAVCYWVALCGSCSVWLSAVCPTGSPHL